MKKAAITIPLFLLNIVAVFFVCVLSNPTRADTECASMITSFRVDGTPPVVVSDLRVVGQTTTSLTLVWTTPGDYGNGETATKYDVRRSSSPITNEEGWNTATPVIGEPEPGIPGSTETFTVNGLMPSTIYWFALKTADSVPNWSDLSNTVSGTPPSTGNGFIRWGVGGGNDEEDDSTPEVIYLQLELDILGKVYTGQVNQDGELFDTIEATSPNSAVTLLFPQGTMLMDHDGNPATSIEVKPATPPDTSTEDQLIIVTYSFQPSCTFNPPIGLTLRYIPQVLVDGISEENLCIAYYDESCMKWVMLPSLVDSEAHTVTASLTHFSTFGLLAIFEEVTTTSTPEATIPPGITSIPEVTIPPDTTPIPEATILPEPKPTLNLEMFLPSVPRLTLPETPKPTLLPVLEPILFLNFYINSWFGVGVSILLLLYLIIKITIRRRHDMSTITQPISDIENIS